MTPLPATERVFTLDVLRGIALLGVFIMNMPGFSHSLFAPAQAMGALDGAVYLLRDLLLAGKFNLLFGLVFGIGFVWQLDRLDAAERRAAERDGRPFDAGRPLAIYARRLAVLLAFGLVHAVLLWPGDVLLIYAVLGLAVLAIRAWSMRALAALLVACLLYPAAAELAWPWVLGPGGDAVAAFAYQQLVASNDAAFGHGAFVDAVRETMHVFAWSATSALGRFNYVAFFVQMATGIVAGVIVGRLVAPGRPWPAAQVAALQRRAFGGALAMAALSVLVVVAAFALAERTPGWARPSIARVERELTSSPLLQLATALAGTLGRAALAAFYALTVVRCCADARWRKRLVPFAFAGRMPLTNYLGQTVLASFVCYGWGLGRWGRLGALEETALAVALFVLVQLPLSAWWLSRFPGGPLERLWRRLSYGGAAR